MATTITPSLGAGALFTQAGVGASGGYAAVDDRRAFTGGLQEGVYAAQSYEVTQRGAGVNLSVDVAATTHENGLAALVQGDSVTGQGLYAIPPHSAVINEAIAAAHATLPRVDRVVLEVQDNTHDASGANAARVRVISGTATSGATLDNLSGAAALPSNCLLLADVHVPATDTTISNAQIRDRRLWARGAYSRAVLTSADPTTASASMTEIDTTNLKPRIECSGVPVRATLRGRVSNTTDNVATSFEIWMDGALVEANRMTHDHPGASGYVGGVLIEWDFVPSAGSHRFAPAWLVDGGTSTLGGTSPPCQFTVQEITQQNRANNTVTSG